MYAIVQTVELEDNKLIIVPDSWVYDDDAQPCCFYPRSISKIVKYVKDAVEPNEKDFVSYKIQILKDEIGINFILNSINHFFFIFDIVF